MYYDGDDEETGEEVENYDDDNVYDEHVLYFQ